jgi:predicted RNase H-like HicB family nuclease
MDADSVLNPRRLSACIGGFQELGDLRKEAAERNNVAKTTILHACGTEIRGVRSRIPTSPDSVLSLASVVSPVSILGHSPRLDFVRDCGYIIYMLTSYIRAALLRAKYELLPDDGSFYGEIAGFQGVYANASTLEGCREELESTLEDWILFRVSKNLSLPEVDGIRLEVAEVA